MDAVRAASVPQAGRKDPSRKTVMQGGRRAALLYESTIAIASRTRVHSMRQRIAWLYVKRICGTQSATAAGTCGISRPRNASPSRQQLGYLSPAVSQSRVSLQRQPADSGRLQRYDCKHTVYSLGMSAGRPGEQYAAVHKLGKV